MFRFIEQFSICVQVYVWRWLPDMIEADLQEHLS